jgi:Leucine-rich repeat (LRR) protein
MNRTLVIALFLWCSQLVAAQDSLRIVTWETALKLSPDSVFAIDASHLKWADIPDELYTFRHLKYLNISRNKLDELPMQLNGLKELVSLDVSRNKLDTFPTVLCSMTYLKKLSVSRNLIESIPPCIGYFDKLVYLDLWDNPIRALPEELTKLEALQKVDLRGILFSQNFQDKWRAKMPQVKWEFDAPCDCLD